MRTKTSGKVQEVQYTGSVFFRKGDYFFDNSSLKSDRSLSALYKALKRIQRSDYCIKGCKVFTISFLIIKGKNGKVGDSKAVVRSSSVCALKARLPGTRE